MGELTCNVPRVCFNIVASLMGIIAVCTEYINHFVISPGSEMMRVVYIYKCIIHPPPFNLDTKVRVFLIIHLHQT